MELELM